VYLLPVSYLTLYSTKISAKLYLGNLYSLLFLLVFVVVAAAAAAIFNFL